MINVKDDVGAILNEIPDLHGKVSDLYPTNWVRLPIVQYIQEENRVHTLTDNREEYSYVRFGLYLWNNDSTSQLILDIDEKMSSLGLKRTQCSDANDPSGLRHVVFHYEGIVDVNTEMVFQDY